MPEGWRGTLRGKIGSGRDVNTEGPTLNDWAQQAVQSGGLALWESPSAPAIFVQKGLDEVEYRSEGVVIRHSQSVPSLVS